MNIQLPEWLENELPDVKTHGSLSYVDGKYIATSPENDKAEFQTLEEAFDHMQNVFKSETTFNENLPEYEEAMGMFFTSKKVINNSVRALLSITDTERKATLEETFKSFLNLASKYENNPDEFMTAYYFVDSHPAFWTRNKNEKTWYWNTSGHCNRMHVSPFKDHDDNMFWEIETGSHVEPKYKEHYHSPKLDSYGSTIEEAYLELASLVFKFYNNDGTAREEVPVPLKDWEIDLIKRIDKMKENTDTEVTHEK